MLRFKKMFENDHILINYDFGWYWGHLASRLRKMYADGKFEDSGMVAWY